MPHKDRKARLDYLAAYHETHRPAPAPLSQEDPALPPIGAYSYSDDSTQIQCHVCGRWYGSLNTHIKTHGLNADSYKERYGLPRSSSLLSPATAEKQRQLALARDQGHKGVSFGADNPPPNRRGLDNRLGSRMRFSAAKKGTYRGRK